MELAVEIGAGSTRIDVLDLEAARTRWERLEVEAIATPFQSFQWVSTLIAVVGRAPSVRAFVVVAHHLPSGRDLMLLPLVRRSYGPVRVIEPPDFGLSDYVTPIVAPEILAEPGHLATIWGQVLKAVPPADIMRISKVPQLIQRYDNPFLADGRFWRKDANSWRVGLPERWTDYEANVLSRNARSLLRRGLRKLESTGPVEHVVASDAATVRNLFAVLCAQRGARFARLGRKDILRQAAYREFYLEIVLAGLVSGLASIAALRRGPDIVATLLGLYWGDAYFVLIPTMTDEADLQKARIGKLMCWLHMRDVHARGYRLFDFTIGNERYKRDFGATPQGLYETVVPLAIQGHPLAAGLRLRAGLKRWREARRLEAEE